MRIVLIGGSGVPLFEQIKDAIRENILGGALPAGGQLPSVRELSRDLKVSILTVKKAYDELEQEGFITTRQGLGSFVRGDNAALVLEEKQKKLEERLLEAIRLSKEAGLSRQELLSLTDYLYEDGEHGQQDRV